MPSVGDKGAAAEWLTMPMSLLRDEANSRGDMMNWFETAKSTSAVTKSDLNKVFRITDKLRCLKKSKQRKAMPGAIDDENEYPALATTLVASPKA